MIEKILIDAHKSVVEFGEAFSRCGITLDDLQKNKIKSFAKKKKKSRYDKPKWMRA